MLEQIIVDLFLVNILRFKKAIEEKVFIYDISMSWEVFNVLLIYPVYNLLNLKKCYCKVPENK